MKKMKRTIRQERLTNLDKKVLILLSAFQMESGKLFIGRHHIYNKLEKDNLFSKRPVSSTNQQRKALDKILDKRLSNSFKRLRSMQLVRMGIFSAVPKEEFYSVNPDMIVGAIGEGYCGRMGDN